MKVQEIEGFEGVFKSEAGDTFDLRPRESCPCLINFWAMEIEKLQELLLESLQEQLERLEKNEKPYDKEQERKLIQNIKGNIELLKEVKKDCREHFRDEQKEEVM